MNTLQDLMKQLVDKQEELKDAQYNVDHFELDESDYEEQYREFIDECTQVVEIMGISFTPSRILEELDPIAFSFGLSEYVNNIDKEESDAYQELEQIVENIEGEIEDLENDIESLENEEK